MRSTERSVARRVRGLVVDRAESEEVGEGFVTGPAEGSSIWIRVREENDGPGVLGELRTASRTGSNAGSGMIEDRVMERNGRENRPTRSEVKDRKRGEL